MEFSNNIKLNNPEQDGNWTEQGIEKELRNHNEDLKNLKDILVEDGQLKFDTENITKNHIINILEGSKEKEFEDIYENNTNASGVVFAIQYLLTDLSYDPGTIDGVYGGENGNTRKTVKKFQEKWNTDNPYDNIKEDGRAGKETIKRMLLKNINNSADKTISKNEEQIKQIGNDIYYEPQLAYKSFIEIHKESEKKFFNMLNHDDFDFNGWTIYGTSKKAQKNRIDFSNLIKKHSKNYNCLMPNTEEKFNKFVEYVGKENIEDYYQTNEDKSTENKVVEYFYNLWEKGETDYTPLSRKEFDESEKKILKLKSFNEGLKIIKEYIKEGDFEKTLVIGKENFTMELLEYIPSNVKRIKLDLNSSLIEESDFEKLPYNLISLNLDGSDKIKNISSLKKLINLEKLILMDCKNIKDFGSLEKLTNLRYLDLDDTQINNISFVKNLNKIETLDIRNTKVKDISILKNLSSLKKLYINGCKEIPQEQIDELKSSNTSLEIEGP